MALLFFQKTIFTPLYGLNFILLQADQRQYVTHCIQIFTVSINAVLVVFLTKLGFGIHVVQLASSVIYILRPILVTLFVKRKYDLQCDVEPDDEAISQRWHGLGHHLAYLLHHNADITLLTLFADLKDVSVYAVYNLVVSSLRQLVSTCFTSLEASFGNMIAKKETSTLEKNFSAFEFSVFAVTTILFTSAALLILPFVSLYTRGVDDADYWRPLLSGLMVLSEAIYCIRTPYNAVILAAGHYKETSKAAYLEAFINIFLSLVLVKKAGITGVVLGTVVAMSFRTIQCALYLARNILYRNVGPFVKKH